MEEEIQAILNRGQPAYIPVRVIPKSGSLAVGDKMADGTWKIKLKSLPEKGSANAELVKFLAKLLHIPRENVRIISGQTSRNKTLQILPNN